MNIDEKTIKSLETYKKGVIIESQAPLIINNIREIEFGGEKVYLLKVNQLGAFVVISKRSLDKVYKDKC